MLDINISMSESKPFIIDSLLYEKLYCYIVSKAKAYFQLQLYFSIVESLLYSNWIICKNDIFTIKAVLLHYYCYKTAKVEFNSITTNLVKFWNFMHIAHT